MSTLITILIIKDLLTVQNRKISSIFTTVLTLPITSYNGSPVYALIQYGNITGYIDVNKLITFTNVTDFTMSYQQLLTNTLKSPAIVQNYLTTIIPTKDITTGMYLNRINVLDPLAETGYTVDYGSYDNPTVLSNPYYIGSSNDLCVSYTGTSPVNFNNFLAAVNGIIHKTIVYNGNLWIIDGYENIRQSGQQSIVLMDTTNVGGHTIVPITSSMIVSPTNVIEQSITLQMPSGISLQNKSVLMSIDGYLKCFDPSYQIISNQGIMVHSNVIDWLSQFINNPNMRYKNDVYGTQNVINPLIPNQVIPVQNNTTNDAEDVYFSTFTSLTAVPTTVFQNPNFIQSRILSPHSFIIIINNSNIYTIQYNLTQKHMYRRYEITTVDTPRGILFHNQGKILSYTLTKSHDNQNTFYLPYTDTSIDNFRTVPDSLRTYIASAQTDGYDLEALPPSYLLEIYSA